jgi:hypothetical protein
MKKCTTAISVNNCKKNVQLKKMYNCKTNLYYNTEAEELTGCSKGFFLLMLFSLTFRIPPNLQMDTPHTIAARGLEEQRVDL